MFCSVAFHSKRTTFNVIETMNLSLMITYKRSGRAPLAKGSVEIKKKVGARNQENHQFVFKSN